jgi:endo-1,4-beta-D-glucanase Y
MKTLILAIAIACFAPAVMAQPKVQSKVHANKPFPQQENFKNCIKPNHLAQTTLNEDVVRYYTQWKKSYLRRTDMPGGYYIHGEATNNKVPSKGTSEGQGFGMIITAIMAGQDDSAKIYFDGLYRFFDTHRSILNDELMGWTVAIDERTNSFDCATDGDLDIAYSLLLADKQWGSTGAVNYLQEARDMITRGLKVSCVSHANMRVVLGDWDTLATATRSSDWMASHFSAYALATGDSFWTQVNDTIYSMVKQITSKYSPSTGLMPDFVTGTPPGPVEAGFLEASHDGDFSWNACRYPWRIAMDYMHYGNNHSYHAAQRTATWAARISGNDPAKFTSVYRLDGTPLETYTSTAFTSPMLVAATVDPNLQTFLNKGWDRIKNDHYAYFNDSINLLCMLAISGNWWAVQY